MSYFFAGFFMQAFFLLNGFTSNFDKPFKKFLWGSFKGLIIPFLSFSVISKVLDGVCFGKWSLWVTVAQGDQSWFFLEESYWFLTALFIARIIYWPVNRYIKNEWIKCFFMLGMLFLGTYVNNIMDGQVNWPAHWDNYFHYRNAMCMVIFLWIGDWMKKHKTIVEPYFKYATLLYFLALVIGIVTHHRGIITGYTHSTDMTMTRIPLFLFFATFGSIAIIWISKKISHNKILEYYGRGSLVVYMTHFFFLQVLVNPLARLIYPTDLLSTSIYFIIAFVVVSLACAGMIWVMQKPYLRKLIGK